ncbi:hypothetical protein evm_005884 [Chilo suppressalis]|nr:hypothetical protein evm_005884 [Chilo suppressalis]
MLFCSRCIQLVFLLPYIYSRGETIEANGSNNFNSSQPQQQDETIFTDVIRNITRVNNVLEELIQNYEKIQKYYDTNSFEKDYSSDIEIDELYKNGKFYNKTKSRTYVDNTLWPKMEFPATAMIFSDDDVSEIEDSAEDNEEVKRADDQKSTADEVSDENSKEDSKELSENARIEDKNTEIKESKIIFLRPHKYKADNSNKIKDLNPKTHHIQNRKHKIETGSTKPINRNVEKIIYAETFPQGKIWDEIARKKPINLRSVNIPSSRLKDNKLHLRTNRSPKTALVIVTKNNKNKRDRIEIPSYLEHVFSSEETNSKIIQSNILRHAYGEACLRMVVKKCYKACKETKKVACKIATCKTSFKEKFIDSAKTGCIKEFKPALLNKSDATFLKKYKKGSDFADSSGDDDDFPDATRNGFPAETCFPFMVQETRSDNQNTNKTSMPLDSKKKILRDRYERACQRASSEKCNTACQYAYKKTCETYECSKSKKRAFTKHCKKQCKMAFKFKEWTKKKSSSSSSTSSSSSSDSGSDSDTDFNTEDFE